MANSFGTEGTLLVGDTKYKLHRLGTLPGGERLPFSLKVLLENLLRHEDDRTVKREDVEALLKWNPSAEPDREIAFRPARVLLQDFTGVPCIVDLAAMRDAITRLGGDAQRINPLVPMDLVIDHSVQVDSFASDKSYGLNVMLEYERNKERYALLRWGQQAFRRFRVVPPGMGICHQVNLEYLAQVVFRGDDGLVYPDTLVGTDSHTTMINSLGVLGWGVGGIEAEAAMLGQPVSMLIPEVVGFKLSGALREGATATDVVLTVTQMLRKKGVVGKFVEYFGPGIAALALPDRATIANMAPEYGATMGFFPVDQETLEYLTFSGRDPEQVKLVEAYCKEQGLFHAAGAVAPQFSDTLELDLGSVEPSLAGPKRPQDRVPLSKVKSVAARSLDEICEKGPDLDARKKHTEAVHNGDVSYPLGHGAVVIAAITSCTNTSNPAVMLGAGLLAKNAIAKGLTQSKPWVKTSLAPGSRVVTEYLKEAGLMPYLEGLGFHLVGYGCTTCIGNSGPLPEPIAEAVQKGDLVVAAVLSGNRNFEGRINALVRMNFLASPMLVVAYALAGSVDVDLQNEPLGHDKDGNAIYLRDIWPTNEQIKETVRAAVKPDQYKREYGRVFDGDESWKKLMVPKGQTFAWDQQSTYVRNPPFFDVDKTPKPVADIAGARCLALLGDSVTTDHISPAGSISKKSPAAQYLMEHGVKADDFNSYGARRGNHEVMMRGTFANIRLRNLMLPGVEGGMSKFLGAANRSTSSDGPQLSIYDAAMKYKDEGVPLVVIAGAEYGTGSSRDWAAKGTLLLGVRAVMAKSFERIHRSNLVGMGVLPLQFMDGDDAATLGLTGYETFDIGGVAQNLAPGRTLEVRVSGGGGG
ncbi:MAG TPA: aconitate hydratase AcnA, partial [Polyangia bacterium]|nr:aconitate hydratase AcnA [Polyangia bacterium]